MACDVKEEEGQEARGADNERLDPRNLMPTNLNEQREKESAGLTRQRQRSSIPKSRDGEWWVYPSPLQLYNAMRRRDKVVDSDDMPDVTQAHNVTNEMSWREIMKFEDMHRRVCPSPTLHHFVGKYDDLSPKSHIISRFSSMGRPFDRHDWYIDRCGRRVRYVLDYYDDPKASNELQWIACAWHWKKVNY
eukprot:Selendium_serpulae@DN4976_c0_g1_i3.p1